MKYRLLAFCSFFMPFLSMAQESGEIGLDQKIDLAFKPVSDFFSSVIFFPIMGTPFVLILLVASAAFFTVYFGFPNIRILLGPSIPLGVNTRILKNTVPRNCMAREV